MYFSVGREGFTMAQLSRREFLRPVISLLAVHAMELAREIPPATDHNETRPRSIYDTNFPSGTVAYFLLRTSNVVASGVPLLRN